MSVQELLHSRRSAIRIAMIVVGVAAYQFLPATQASTTDNITVIRFSWARTGFITALVAWAGISSLSSAYKNNSEENRWQLASFGMILLGLVIYILPGMILSKLTIDAKSIIIEDYRTWGSKIATLEWANAKSVRLRIITVPENWTPRNTPTPRNFIIIHYTDGTTQSAVDIGLLDPYGIAALLELSERFGLTLIDERTLEK